MPTTNISDMQSDNNDVIVNLDLDKDLVAIDRISGAQLVRVILIKDGKETITWIHVGMYKGHVILDIESKTSTDTCKRTKVNIPKPTAQVKS